MSVKAKVAVVSILVAGIAVIGAGAWGTALAIALGRKGSDSVRLWANEPEVRESIAERRVNERFLPGFTLPHAIEATNDLTHALDGAEIVVSVMPSPTVISSETEDGTVNATTGMLFSA